MNRKMLKVEPDAVRRVTPHDAHPFEPRDGDDETCAFCGAPKQRILHHPTRVCAAETVFEIANEKCAAS